MSVVDAPPLLPFVGRPAATVKQKRAAIRRARRGLVYAGILGACTLALATHKLPRPSAEMLAITPFVLVSIQLACYAIRRARLTVIGDALRWGLSAAGIQLSRQRTEAIIEYADGLAICPARGSQWFFATRDWESFAPLCEALADAGFPVGREQRPAPVRTRLKGYGLALDILIIVDCIAATATFVAALAL